MDSSPPPSNHRFLDEAGDTTFYGKGKVPIVGSPGVSQAFILGMVKIRAPLAQVRTQIEALQQSVLQDPYFRDIPSIEKKRQKGGYYFHATDDLPEVRKLFYEYLKQLDCSFEAVVGRKIPDLYERKHHGREADFYADLLSHLLKNKLNKGGKLVLNIAGRGKTTKNQNLEEALAKATARNRKRKDQPIRTQVVFNVQNHLTEPILNVADYFCWAIQRVFERGEMRYYHFVQEKVSLVIDLYDTQNYQNSGNYYGRRRPLTASNCLSPKK